MRFLKKATSYIANMFRGTVWVIGTLLGVKWRGEWGAEGLIIAGWIFFLGIPAGMLLFGPTTFHIGIWLLTVLLILMITNVDDALVQMSNYLTYGVDGTKIPYGEQECSQ